MDNIDKKLLNLVQNGLPIESRPFLTVGKKLGITEEEVINRLEKLKRETFIRRIGGIFDSKKLGYVSTLCAISVPEERIEDVSKIINEYEEVTHNYIRNHHYNMWFTIIAQSKEKIDEVIRDIKSKAEINRIINLPSVKLFKIRATFHINGG